MPKSGMAYWGVYHGRTRTIAKSASAAISHELAHVAKTLRNPDSRITDARSLNRREASDERHDRHHRHHDVPAVDPEDPFEHKPDQEELDDRANRCQQESTLQVRA